MKKLLKITVLLLAIGVQPLNAQQIDMQEMRQDIDILEGVLEEMFEFERKYYEGVIGIEEDRVSGIYLSDYGILFQITDPASSYVKVLDADDKPPFTISQSDGDDAIAKDAIKSKIINFLGSYASTIDQLRGNDRVTVIFGVEPVNEGFQIFYADEPSLISFPDLPVIAISARASEIKAYVKDEITESEFKERLSISVGEKDEKVQTDLKIMANILETAFDEGEDEEFEISGDVEYSKIDNFGALFSFEIVHGGPFGALIHSFSDAFVKIGEVTANVGNVMDSVANGLAEVTNLMTEGKIKIYLGRKQDHHVLSDVTIFRNGEVISLDSLATYHLDSLTVDMDKLEENYEQYLKKLKGKQAEHREYVQQALLGFISQLKETIIDYGPTLDSVSPNQMLLFSIEVNSGFDELPERIVVQVEKSVLRAAGRGEISRYEAMEEVLVRKIQ